MINKTIWETGDGGSFVVDNDIKIDGGIYTAIYLAMFSSVTPYFNNSVLDLSFDSQTEKILSESSTDDTGIENIKRAIKEDLNNINYATTNISVTIIDNTKIEITIEAKNNDTLQVVWDSTEKQVIEYKTI